MAHYMVNSKVFKTEDEARAFSKDLMARGGLGGWCKVNAPVTHVYIGDGMTQPLDELFDMIKDQKGVTA